MCDYGFLLNVLSTYKRGTEKKTLEKSAWSTVKSKFVRKRHKQNVVKR